MSVLALRSFLGTPLWRHCRRENVIPLKLIAVYLKTKWGEVSRPWRLVSKQTHVALTECTGWSEVFKFRRMYTSHQWEKKCFKMKLTNRKFKTRMTNNQSKNITNPKSLLVVLLSSQQFIDPLPIAVFSLVLQITLFRPGSQTWRTWVEGVFISQWKKIFEKMKVHNKTVIDRLLGQQQLCVTLDRIFCPQLAALGNRSDLEANKTAVVLEHSQ